MKHECQYKIMFTRSQLESLKSEALELGIPVSDLIRGKLFGDNVQNNVQNNAHQDVSLCDWYQEIQKSIGVLGAETRQEIAKLNRTLEQLQSDVEAHRRIISSGL